MIAMYIYMYIYWFFHSYTLYTLNDQRVEGFSAYQIFWELRRITGG